MKQVYCKLDYLLAFIFVLSLVGCGGSDGNDPVADPSAAPTITNFIASPNQIISGNSTILTPVFSNGTGEIDNNVGTVSSGVSVTVKPTSMTIYTLTVTGATTNLSPVTKTVTVDVQPSTAYRMGGALQGTQLDLMTTVTTLVGPMGALGNPGSADGTGADVQFNSPYGITTDGTYLYVADSQNSIVRQIVITSGVTTTLVGTLDVPGSADGTGITAEFDGPRGITTDGENLYVADTNNSTVRQIVIATGEVTTLAGTAGQPGSTDGFGTNALFNTPSGITTDNVNLYVLDNSAVRQIEIATGEVTTLAGTPDTIGSTDGAGENALFNTPSGITTDGTRLFVTDVFSYTVRQIMIATGEVTTLAGTADTYGSSDGTGANAQFSHLQGITTDGTHLYVVDTVNNTIRKIVIATGVVTTLVGTPGLGGIPGVIGWVDGIGAEVEFNIPIGITTDGNSLYVTDSGNHNVRKID